MVDWQEFGLAHFLFDVDRSGISEIAGIAEPRRLFVDERPVENHLLLKKEEVDETVLPA